RVLSWPRGVCGDTASIPPRRLQMATKEEVLEYARECKRRWPKITDEQLRAFLEAKFIEGTDPLAVGVNPIVLALFRGGAQAVSSGADLAAIKDIIEGVITILRKEPGTATAERGEAVKLQTQDAYDGWMKKGQEAMKGKKYADAVK